MDFDPIELVSKEAEQAVIGSVLLDHKRSFPMLRNMGMTEHWFYSEQNSQVFAAIMSLSSENKAVDITTVQTLLTQRGADFSHSDMVLQNSIDGTTSSTHAQYYGEILKDYYLKRQQKLVMEEHIGMLRTDDSHHDIMSSLRDALELIEIPEDGYNLEEVKIKILRSHHQAKTEGMLSVPSRFPSFMRKLLGYRKGKICMVAARPSIGKTTLALNEAEYMGSQNYRVGIVSLETEIDEIYEPLAGINCEVDLFALRNNSLNLGEEEKFKKSLDKVMAYPIYITDRNMDIDHLVNWINYMCYHKELDVIIIDYLQIISERQLSKMSERERINRWSKKVFEATRLNGVATILLSQLNRSAEPPSTLKPDERWKWVPKLHPLKESGKIEEDAYQALILYNHPTESTENAVVVPFVVDVAKHKRGPTGRIDMTYFKARQRFKERHA